MYTSSKQWSVESFFFLDKSLNFLKLVILSLLTSKLFWFGLDWALVKMCFKDSILAGFPVLWSSVTGSALGKEGFISSYCLQSITEEVRAGTWMQELMGPGPSTFVINKDTELLPGQSDGGIFFGSFFPDGAVCVELKQGQPDLWVLSSVFISHLCWLLQFQLHVLPASSSSSLRL